MAGRPIGSVNKRSRRAAELFGPHVDDAIAVLKQIAANDDVMMRLVDGKEVYMPASRDADRIAACKIICEYGLGKPAQPVTGGVDDDGNDIPIGVKVTFV